MEFVVIHALCRSEVYPWLLLHCCYHILILISFGVSLMSLFILSASFASAA